MMVDKNKPDVVNSSSEPLVESSVEEISLTSLLETEYTNPRSEGLVDRDTGMGRTMEKLRTTLISGSGVTGGDLDDNLYQAEVVGEEAVGGQTPTPDQNVTEDLLDSMGIASLDGEPVRTSEKLEWRDRKRWELDPESAEDYPEHFE